MGRGGGRGRGRNKKHGRRGQQSTPMPRKDVVHMRQFGEKHPSQDLSRDFGPTPSKRGKFDGKRGGQNHRGRGGKYSSSGSTSLGDFRDDERERTQVETSGSSEDEDEEATPYNELLTELTGKKVGTTVQIISDDEEDDTNDENEEDDSSNDIDEEQNIIDDNDDNSDSHNDSDDDEQALENCSKKDLEGSSVSSESKIATTIKDCDRVSTTNMGGDRYPSIVTAEDGGANLEDLDEATVIEDAEIDPEIDDTVDTRDYDGLDPFIQHFEREIGESLQKCLKEDKKTIHTFDWPVIERVLFQGLDKSNDDEVTVPQKTINISELDNLPPVKVPDPPVVPLKNASFVSLHIKSQLHDTISLANQANIDKECSLQLTSLQTELFDMASRYHDLYFPKRTISNAEEIRVAYCIHAANHIMKTRSRILHHNAKMANKSEVPESYRDQGFVRPKVLILAPFKDSALRIVKTIISIILKEEKGNVANKKRFADEYGGQTLFMPKTNPKPEDYCVTFNGNVEDNFKIGMAITKKSIKLYTGFYSSDIIVASPLGLRMIIGAEGEKDRDYDFLSSIELLIMDQADTFIMQNWDHVLHLVRHLHLQPVTTHGTDFARIRPWALDGLSKYYCQTMIFSSVACPEHSSLLSRYCKNFAGQVRIMPINIRGSICHVTVQLPQIFQNFDVSSIQDVDEKRFEYFTKNVLPNFKGKLMSHTLIFVSSYFDFVRIRNFFKRDEVSFVQICEYTKDKKIARSRDLFFHGANHFLLYTERAHFFRRHRLKGIGHIIFYQLPQNPQFYPELCNFIQENSQNKRVRQRRNSSVNVIYCKYDAPRLAPIVGTERASYMLNSEKKVHAFVSGEL